MSEIQSLARGLIILQLLGESSDGVTITELAEQLGVDKGTASRLVSTLAGFGYVERNEDTRRYHLGSQVVSLSRKVLTRMPLREVAKPFLRQLMEQTGECAHLAIHAQGKALYIDQVESPASLRVNAQVGTMNPLHCTALGKILLAFGGAELPASLEQYTQNTIIDYEKLATHLEQVRKSGYATDNEEFDIGVRCIAVPIFDFRGKIIGAMGISGPSSRLTLERLEKMKNVLMETGRQATQKMAFSR
jgi:IclR family transcriptional regulator, KDG regulon repressor